MEYAEINANTVHVFDAFHQDTGQRHAMVLVLVQ